MTVRTTTRPTKVAATGLIATAAAVVGVMVLVTRGTSDHWGAFVVGLVLVAITLPFLRNSAARHNEQALFALFVLGLLLRIGGAIIRSYVDIETYGGSDSAYYHQSGIDLAEKFHAGNFDTELPSKTSTNFIRFFTGVVYTVIGPARLGAFMFYAWLGFVGSFLFYRAFTLAVPEGRRSSYAKLIFLLPSFLFWPSSIGKEAWMMFSLGLAALGAARFVAGKPLRGLMVAATGLWLGAIVRPHIAGVMGIALAAAVLVRRPSRERGQLAPIARLVTLGAVALLAFLLVGRTEQFLIDRGIETRSGITTALEQASERAAYGGSYIAPSIAASPRRVPIAVITVLYRPLIIEAHNTQALVTGAETAFLLALSIVRLRWAFGTLRLLRERPYVALCAAHSLLMILVLSNAANFGLLARHRVQLLPFFLVLLCIPPRSRAVVDTASVGRGRRA